MAVDPPKTITRHGAAVPFHLRVLREELAVRKRENPRYSLRAFARALGLDPAAMSRILSGKQNLSAKACPTILQQVALSKEDFEKFLASVSSTKATQTYETMKHRIAQSRTSSDRGPPTYLPRKIYEVLADRYHLQVLELVDREDFRADPEWIAHTLRMTELHVNWVISVLIKAGLLFREGESLRRRNSPGEETANPPPNADLVITRKIFLDPLRLVEMHAKIDTFFDTLQADAGSQLHEFRVNLRIFPRTLR